MANCANEERTRHLAILNEYTLGDAAEERLFAECAVESYFDFYARLEPQLIVLRDSVRVFRQESESADRVCANAFWFNVFKPQLLKLVGLERPVHGENRSEHVLEESGSLADFLNQAIDEKEARERLIAQLPEDMQSLYGSHAYSVCYEAMYEELPDCKNCHCW